MNDHYPLWQNSPTGYYELRRDGKVILRDTDVGVYAYLHRNYPHSIQTTLLQEGYSILPYVEERDSQPITVH